MAKTAAAIRDVALNDVTSAVDVGGTGFIDTYSGSPPAHPEDAPTGTLLASNDMSATAFAASSGGVAVANAITDATILATLTAGYWRLVSGGGTVVMQGTVTVTGGGGSLTYDTVSFVTGRTCTIASFQITLAEGT